MTIFYEEDFDQTWVVGMKVSIGSLGFFAPIVQLTESCNDGFKTHNLVNGTDGFVSKVTLDQIGELVG